MFFSAHRPSRPATGRSGMRCACTLLPLLLSCFLTPVTAGAAPEAEPAVENSERAGEPMPPGKALAAIEARLTSRIDLFAAEPLIRNPVAACVDAAGRLLVAENLTYAEKPLKRDPRFRDRVTMLEDADGDGIAERHATLVDGLEGLASAVVGRGGLWLLCPPRLLFIPGGHLPPPGWPDAPDHDEPARRRAAAVPILDGFTADPSIRVFGDTYYVYPTSDKPNWLTTDFSVWSSKDLVTWKKERMVLDVANDLKWANLRAWAPDCIERDGTYFFYFCAEGKVGVATGRSPAGPFVDAIGKPLLDRKADARFTTNPIDPYPFIDDDGQAYLFWGNGAERANALRLSRDMLAVEGDLIDIPIKGRSSGVVVDFREGVVVFKRAGRYYFMWSVDDARSDDYRVAYGTAASPLGPVTIPAEGSLVLAKNGPVKGTGHHSVVNVPGTDRWYVAYHRHAIPDGSGYKRETCLARMEFNLDGSIRPIDPMVPAFQPGDTGEPIVNGRGR